MDKVSDDLLEHQRNLPDKRGRGRDLEEYHLKKEYLLYEVGEDEGEGMSAEREGLQRFRKLSPGRLHRCLSVCPTLPQNVFWVQ